MLLTELSEVMTGLDVGDRGTARFLEEHKPEKPSDHMILSIATAFNSALMFDKAEEVMRSHVFTPAEGEEYITAVPYMYACLCRGRLALKQKKYEEALAFFENAMILPENLNAGFWNESVLIP